MRGPGLSGKTHALLDEAVPGEFFAQPDGLAPRERQELTYRRLRAAGRAAPPAAELLNDPPALCALLERAAIADPALFHVMLLHYTLALGPILRFGAEQEGPRRERESLESMASFGTLLMTEVGRSNSHLSPRTLARFDAATGGFVLETPDARAVKFPTSTAHPAVPKTAAVYATLVHGGAERGVFVFVVPLRGPDGTPPEGVTIVPAPDTTGLQVDYAAVRLDGLRVPYEAWLRDGARLGPGGSFHDPAGGPAQRLTRSMGIAPAVWRAVVSVSAAITRASAHLLWAHSADRSTLGRLAPRRPLTDYRNQREAVLGALATAYALTAVAGRVKRARTGADGPDAAADADPGGGPETAWAPWSAVDRDLALLKAAATELAQETVSMCRVHAGAPGFTATDRLNGYRGLAHAYMNAGGDNELILFDTARAMADLDRYVPPRAGPAPRGGGDLLDPGEWVRLAGECEARMRERLAARVAAELAAGADAFAAWNANLALAARTARACGDRMVLEVCARAAGSGPAVLRPLLGLHALGWMDRRAGTLLDAGVLEPGSLQRVWDLRGRLGEELAPRAAELAAALEVPAEVAAPVSFVPGL
ncbi:acyl-CoA dehydrogenase [Actinomadura sp. 21ATH]|uniref:acyl-CoA dehydrogenase family protein n=1 Tax=Actinomadura sp. 21ATH TaxID=1735444 RepID=UPI0035BFC86A